MLVFWWFTLSNFWDAHYARYMQTLFQIFEIISVANAYFEIQSCPIDAIYLFFLFKIVSFNSFNSLHTKNIMLTFLSDLTSTSLKVIFVVLLSTLELLKEESALLGWKEQVGYIFAGIPWGFKVINSAQVDPSFDVQLMVLESSRLRSWRRLS